MNRAPSDADRGTFFTRADWYDLGIDWSARIAREVPVLTDALGPPGDGGVLDAGCGPGHQGVALARSGYRVTALDTDAGMLALAAKHAADAGVAVRCVQGSFSAAPDFAGGGFDGVYSLGNALAATADRETCREAFEKLGASLRPGGRFFAQVLNFRRLRAEAPVVRGPRRTVHDGVEYVSVRHFGFDGDRCTVTNITLWNDGAWRVASHGGTLYPMDVDEVRAWCERAHLRVKALYGSYAKDAFDADRSNDLIVLASREP